MKKKVKKAYNGIQRVTPNYSKVNAQQDQIAGQQGMVTSIASTAANSIVPGVGTALGAVDGAISAATKDDKGLYRSKFAEFADTRLNPLGGLKVLASGNGKAIGNYLSFGMAGKSLNSQIKEQYADADRKAKNDTFNSGLMNEVPLQRKQFKKGSRGTTSKIIEIEGKKSPEIHTDASFNIKNLGVTPHSKGGDKVLAEVGDVVFPTQNSPKKYGKIMKAIKEKDLPTLKKEQSKLPKDSKTYAKGGVVDGDETPKEKLARLRAKAGKAPDVRGESSKKAIDFQKGVWNGVMDWTREVDSRRRAAEDNLKTSDANYQGLTKGEVAELKALEQAESSPAKKPITPAEKSKSGTKTANKEGYQVGKSPGTPKSGTKSTYKSGKGTSLKDDSIIKLQKQVGAKQDGIYGKETARKSYESLKGSSLDDDISALETHAQGVAEGKYDDVTPPESYMAENPPVKKIGWGANANKAMELAPIAYNLGQGLFGKTEKVQRSYITPEMNTYTDLSDPLRQQSTQAYATDRSNARNLSGGSLSNVRSNSQAASNREMDRRGNINAQEIARQDAIAQSNVGVRNAAKQTNLQLDNQYNEIDTQNRAAKTGMLQAGLLGLAQIGSRNIQNAAAVDAQGRELKAISGVTNYEFEKDRLGATGNITFDGKNVVDLLQGTKRELQDGQIKQLKAESAKKTALKRDRLFRIGGRRIGY